MHVSLIANRQDSDFDEINQADKKQKSTTINNYNHVVKNYNTDLNRLEDIYLEPIE